MPILPEGPLGGVAGIVERRYAGCTHFVPITDDHEVAEGIRLPSGQEPAEEAVPRDQTED